MTTKTRESNIELLRLFATICVVFLHANLGHLYTNSFTHSSTHVVSIILETICVCAVNIFFLISGFFLSKTNTRSYRKPLTLLIQVVVFALASYLVSKIWRSEPIEPDIFLRLLPHNYFVTFYVVLFVISPYINILLSRLSKNAFKALLLISILIFSVWPSLIDYITPVLNLENDGYDTISRYGSDWGYNIMNFVNLYLIGAYLQSYGIPQLGKRKLLLIYGGGVLMTSAQLLLGVNMFLVLAYNNPLVIIMAVLLFCIFSSLSFRSRFINGFTKASFTCYLIHFKILSRLGLERLASATPLTFILTVTVYVAIVLAISYIVYFVYDKLSEPIIKRIVKGDINYKLDNE